MNFAQALWLVLGYAQRNQVPDVGKSDAVDRPMKRGTMSEFLAAMGGGVQPV